MWKQQEVEAGGEGGLEEAGGEGGLEEAVPGEDSGETLTTNNKVKLKVYIMTAKIFLLRVSTSTDRYW